MKFALCLSGQVRSYETAYSSLKANIIDLLEPDIFFHTWARRGIKDSIESIKGSKPTRYQETEALNINDLVRTYRPKSFLVEDDKLAMFKKQAEIIKPLHVAPWYRIENGLSMQYSIWRANSLKSEYENALGFQYDGVIRCRFDLAFSTPIDIRVNLNAMANTIFLAPKMNEDWRVPFDMPNDQCAYSSSILMDYYASLYTYFEYYVNRRKRAHFDFPFTGEGMLRAHLFKSPLRPVGLAIEEAAISMRIVRFP
jgi:hypothetical protein